MSADEQRDGAERGDDRRDAGIRRGVVILHGSDTDRDESGDLENASPPVSDGFSDSRAIMSAAMPPSANSQMRVGMPKNAHGCATCVIQSEARTTRRRRCTTAVVNWRVIESLPA